ncbi:SLATT domain-containing protein [Kribbella sp. NPDC058245]|uniref:SLATT domain-containing protein n=1 Tax=Kribbella sp. NPDC058245 TaxID=3346399 RepID=UPI0036E7F8DB
MASGVDNLLELNRTLLTLERQLREARAVRRGVRLALVGLPFATFAALALGISPQFGVDKRLIGWPLGVAIAAMVIGLAAYGFGRSDGNAPPLPEDLELELAVAREQKVHLLAGLAGQTLPRQYAYWDELGGELETLRRSAAYYRRINNYLQSTVIVGSLAATAVTSLSLADEALRWAGVGTTFAVGLAAGFTGYFKFRERSFYLQQTADAVEYERNCFNLGIGRYKGKPEQEALVELVEEVERLRAEQRKREQNIDQPPERADS